MKIGFDVSQTGKNKAGCGYFADNLIRYLSVLDKQNEYILYPTFGDHFWDHEFQETFSSNQKNFKRAETPTRFLEAKNFWQASPDYLNKALGEVDIIHANNFYCPPKFKNTKLIYT